LKVHCDSIEACKRSDETKQSQQTKDSQGTNRGYQRKCVDQMAANVLETIVRGIEPASELKDEYDRQNDLGGLEVGSEALADLVNQEAEGDPNECERPHREFPSHFVTLYER
jgi:hypothetical protein